VLHPPYTVWHLSYVVFGAGLAPKLSWAMLLATVVAFLLAVGVGAHVLDELNGRPLGTAISATALKVAAAISLAGAVLLGAFAVRYSSVLIIPCIVIGVLLVLGYNLELFRGRLHTDLGFAIGWGGFPVAVGFLAQAPPLTKTVSLAAVVAAIAAIALSYAQRRLSTPARTIRRRLLDIQGTATLPDGTTATLGSQTLMAPLEGTLRALCWTVPLAAIAVLLARLH
jgi:hypothetical protein